MRGGMDTIDVGWLDSGPGIEAMSDYVAETAAPNAYVATRDEVRHWPKYGRWASGKDLRYYVRRYYPGGEAQFVADHERKDGEMPSKDALNKARRNGSQAGGKGKPRTSNPYAQDDPRFEMWDTGYRSGRNEAGLGEAR